MAAPHANLAPLYRELRAAGFFAEPLAATLTAVDARLHAAQPQLGPMVRLAAAETATAARRLVRANARGSCLSVYL